MEQNTVVDLAVAECVDNTQIGNLSLLGKPTPYINHYDKSLLVAIPRKWGRDAIGLVEPLPFSGIDIWNAYEVSFLDLKGKPVGLMLKIAYAPTSPFLVESKSLKMYLNSLNLTHYKDTKTVIRLIEDDLSDVLKTPVFVQPLSINSKPDHLISGYEEYACIDEIDLEPTVYEVDPSLLKLTCSDATLDSSNEVIIVNEKLVTHLFKSNCPCTHLPDFASIFIEYTGPQIDHSSLLAYFISFREHQAFHEQCVEQIFTHILEYCKPEKLTVFARFTRRGGLDINPYRTTNPEALNAENLRTLRQ